MGKTLYPPGAIFCKTCGYCLHGLPEPRCPECGQGFDPADPRTFRRRPPRIWPRRLLLWGGIPLLLLTLAYGSLLGWLYWGWKAEAPARALPQWVAEQGKADPSVVAWAASVAKTEPLLPAGWRWMILPACRPWMERVNEITLYINRRPADLAERLATCRQIKKLMLYGLPLEGQDVAAIARLSELTELRLWGIADGGVVDDQALAALARLPHLQALWLGPTRVTDRGLEVLANLTNLQKLGLVDSPALTDRAVEALCRCKGLKELYLYNVSLSQVGIARLNAGLPACTVKAYSLQPAPARAPAPGPAGRGENGG